MVKMVKDSIDFHKELKNAGDRVVVLDFTASWCGPCRTIAPIFEELADKYTNMVFLKVDVDEVGDVSQEYSIDCMPTFIFIKNGKQVGRFTGLSGDTLRARVEEYSKK